MRVFYQKDNNCLFVQGSKNVYPAKSLSLTVDNDYITIWISGGERAIAKSRYQKIQDKFFNHFTTKQEVIDYLTQEFDRSYENINLINDSINSEANVYSSEKVEERLQNEIGNEDFNFELLFENRLSQNT